MAVKLEKLEENRVSMEIEIPGEEFVQAYEKAAREKAKTVTIPGFRKGKVPVPVLEKNVGVEALLADTLEAVVPDAYRDAVEETRIEPIEQPEIELVNVKKTEPLVFRARVQVKPKAVLGEYRGLPVERTVRKATGEDVEQELGNMQVRYARVEDVEDGPLEQGDIAIFDYEGFLDGEPFEGGKAEKHVLEIGSDSFVDGFEEQMVGMKAGEEREIRVTFPEDYREEKLAGRETLFQVQLRKVKRKKLLPLDDEFARDVSEHETIGELREEIRTRLQEKYDRDGLAKMRQELMEQAAGTVTVDIPDVMVERRIDTHVQDVEQRMEARGMKLEEYLQHSGITMEKIRDDFRERATREVRIDLTLEAIVEQEGIEASPEEIEAELDRLSSMYGQEKDNIKEFFQRQGQEAVLREAVTFEKAIDVLQEHARITEVEASAEPEEGSGDGGPQEAPGSAAAE